MHHPTDGQLNLQEAKACFGIDRLPRSDSLLAQIGGQDDHFQDAKDVLGQTHSMPNSRLPPSKVGGLKGKSAPSVLSQS